jgi:signal peptidase I
MENNAVRIITDGNPEGFLLSERYVSPQNFGGPVRERTELKENEYFVLGDNRHVSSDSRVWGVLPRHDVVGRVMLRLFPFTRIDFFPGKADY